MNRIKYFMALSAGVLLLCAETVLAVEQRVTELLDDPVSIYAKKADYFVKQENVSKNDIALPTPVLEESARGYVKISVKGKEVWLDLMDVQMVPPKSSGDTRCISTSSDAIERVARGASEGCK